MGEECNNHQVVKDKSIDTSKNKKGTTEQESLFISKTVEQGTTYPPLPEFAGQQQEF